MERRAAASLSPDEIRAFVLEHMARNRGCDLAHVTSGWRVRFSRPIEAREAALVREAYEEEAARQRAQRALELAEAEARKPKGPTNRFLAMGWRGQMLFGLVIFLVALYAGCIAFYPLIARGTLFGGTAATGAPIAVDEPGLSPGSQGLVVPALQHPGVAAATSFLFWTILVTGGVGGIVILLIGWAIGYGVIRGLRTLLRRPERA